MPDAVTPKADDGQTTPASEEVLREAWIIGRNEFRYLFFTVRTLAPMLIYAAFGALAVFAFIWLGDRAREEVVNQFGDKAVEVLQKRSEELTGSILEFVHWGTKGDAAELFRDKVPLLIVFFFALSSFFLPLLVAVVTFDQFSELSTRGARFVLLRVRRGSYFVGKIAAAWLSVSAFLLVMWTVVVALAIVHDGTELTAPALREGVRAWALMSLLALPYLALTAFVSSLVTPGLAFILTLGSLIAIVMGNVIVGRTIPWTFKRWGWESAAEAERHLLAIFPWHHAPKLISRDGMTLASGVGSLLLIALIGYLLTFFVIRRRDV
jgi:ABC-type transport system involved in multi-copper enzyme maturation permease subunit